MLKLNPGQPTLWLTPQTIQIGADTSAVIVDGLSPAHQRFIRALQAGLADNQLAAAARQARLSNAETTSLLQRLSSQLLDSASGQSEPSKPATTMELLRQTSPDFAELIAFSLATNRDGARALASRVNRVLFLERLDRTGVTLLRGLAAIGFGQFWTEDRGEVSEADTSALGVDRGWLGKSRFDAACDLANGFSERVAMLDTSSMRRRVLDRIDLAVFTGGEAIDPARIRAFARHGVPHIGVLFRSTGVLVLPVVTPNKSACLSCLELALHSGDDAAAVKLVQFRRSSTAYDDASSVLFAASMVTASAAEFLDGVQGFAHSKFERTGWLFERASGNLIRLEWPELTACGCHLGGYSEVKNLDGDAARPNESTAA